MTGHGIEVLDNVFGEDWRALTETQRELFYADVREIMFADVVTFAEAARISRARLGGAGNLASYVACLEAGQRRRART